MTFVKTGVLGGSRLIVACAWNNWIGSRRWFCSVSSKKLSKL